MSENTIRPSTIDGVKSLAKKLKRDRSIRHSEALDAAAQAAGYSNFTNANRQLSDRARQSLWITARWFDRTERTRGQETLKLVLTKAYGELVTPTHATNDRYLGNVRADAPDHLVVLSVSGDRDLARRRVCEVARTLQFMDATGLKPSRARRIHPKGSFDDSVPGEDRPSVWWDPENRRHVRTDEPYVRAEDPVDADRVSWAERHGWEMAKPAWGSIYWADGGCWLFLMADRAKGPSIAPLAEALERAPRPVAASRWTGTSGRYHAPVETPGTRAAVAAEASRMPTTRRPARKRASVAYVKSFDGRRLRPDARMPVEAHREVGRLLTSVLEAAALRDGARTRVNRILDALGEWVMHEYAGGDVDDGVLSGIHRRGHDGDSRPLSDREEMIGRLDRAKSILVRHYPDCPPVDAVVDQADKAIASLKSWRT